MAVARTSLAVLAEDWLTDKQTLGSGLSANSEVAYRSDLRRLAALLVEDSADPADAYANPLNELTAADLTVARVRGGFADLARSGASVSTRTRAIGVWKGFTSWLIEQGHIAEDPMAGISRPRKAEALPVAFTDKQLDAILRAAQTPDPTARQPWTVRDRALVVFLAGTGVRASELSAINTSDVTGGPVPTVRLHGKGGKTRIVPLSPQVVEAIADYLADRRKRFGLDDGAGNGVSGQDATSERRNSPAGLDAMVATYSPSDPLWVGYRNARLSRGALKQYVYRWLQRAGVPQPDGEAVHAFRHTFATGLINNGVDLPTVRQLLGHASIASTQIYLRMTGADLAQAVRVAPITTLAR